MTRAIAKDEEELEMKVVGRRRWGRALMDKVDRAFLARLLAERGETVE